MNWYYISHVRLDTMLMNGVLKFQIMGRMTWQYCLKSVRPRAARADWPTTVLASWSTSYGSVLELAGCGRVESQFWNQSTLLVAYLESDMSKKN